MNQNELKSNALSGIFWKIIENFGTQFISFVIQIIIARLLLPRDYGIIALTSVTLNISSVFINTGFSSALIQKEKIDDIDYSSVFYIGLISSIFIYIVIFVSSPMIAFYFEEPFLKNILRVQAISIVLGALSSVQDSILTRKLDFKSSFKFRICGTIIQGLFGVALALNGMGAWALVISTLVNSLFITISLWHIVKWRPVFIFSMTRLKQLFSFSSKVLLVNILNLVSANIKSLVIGKNFDSAILGYYNRGYQIPNLIAVNTDGAINAVMYPVFSRFQNETERLLFAYRRSIKTSIYVLFPILLGLVAIAEPLTILLLTEKWLPSVPFLRLNSILCMTWPFNIMYHAFNSLGKSEISLKLNLFSHILFILTMILSFKYGVYVFVISTIIGSVITILVGSYLLKKILNYMYIDQIVDVFPILLISISMMIIAIYFGNYFSNNLFKIIAQITIGGIYYLFISKLFCIDSFEYLLNLLKRN